MSTQFDSSPAISEAFRTLDTPATNSHKGENGKMIFIGGSELFHAPARWALLSASRFVDMLFYSSVPQTEALLQIAKQEFWDGIVVPAGKLTEYIEEADVALIGPGMERTKDTEDVTNELLRQFPAKKWVVDAGALQMLNPSLLTNSMIITPHAKELERLSGNMHTSSDEAIKELSERGVTILLKGEIDVVYSGLEQISIPGGNPGMTKGGTGDVLAGMLAGLYATNNSKMLAS